MSAAAPASFALGPIALGPGEGVPTPVDALAGPCPIGTGLGTVGAASGGRPGGSKAKRRGRRKVKPYQLTAEQRADVIALAAVVRKSLRDGGVKATPYRLAVDAGNWRLRYFLQATESRCSTSLVRRPRRSTLERIADAAGLPSAVVADWCAAVPGAIAKERGQ